MTTNLETFSYKITAYTYLLRSASLTLFIFNCGAVKSRDEIDGEMNVLFMGLGTTSDDDFTMI